MRLPKIENYDNSTMIRTLDIPKVSPVERTYCLMNDKDKIMLIKTVERIVRGSMEYKQYIQFLKSEINMNECSFFSNVTNNNADVSIEIHHEPFTLFDITQIVLEKFIHEDMEINPLLIANEVMKLHYKDLVGLLPLSVTVHQLVHDGKLFIPLQNVYGDYVSFLKEYGEYIPVELNNMLEMKLKLSKEVDTDDTSILEKQYVYLNVDGFNFPQFIQQ